MDRNDQVRKEPTLADLDAFEKLLRESLQAGPAKEPVLDQAPAAPSALPHSADQAAMAELTRLIDTPLEFETPLRGAIPPQVAMAEEPALPAYSPAPPAFSDEPFIPHAAPAPVEPQHRHVHGSVEAALSDTWAAPPVVEASFTPSHAPASQPAPEPLDPLAAFEEELRRFDAIRLAEHAARPVAIEAPVPAAPTAAPYPAASYEHEHYATAREQPADANWYQEPAAGQPDYAAESRAESSLNAAEERLAIEAAAAAASAGATRGAGRSKGIFLALGGIAVAGLAVVGGSLVLGSGKKGGTAGDVPTIAARTEPTKEKPADPGGIEIPNLNKQVLAARNTPETKPAAVVNNTEQPLDLNQVTKRDSVRVIAPSPYQSGQPVSGTPTTLETAPPGAAVEPLRVTSVKIPVGGEAAPAPTAASATPSLAGAAGASALTAGASARPSTPAPQIPAAQVPAAQVPPAQTAAAQAATKVESRPVTAAQPRPETPKVAPPPKVATAPAAPKASPPKVTPPKNGPLPLNPAETAAPVRNAATGGAGGYAIQLASRPTESDAQSASSQLKGRFASTLGSRSPGVVSGEANGQTVYRVRVGGYSQADAVAACTKIKAAGGGCFVTKQ